MSGNSKLLLGFAAGIAAGVGIYALLKTEKGQKIVTELKKKASDLKTEMEGLAAKGKGMAENMKEKFSTS